MLLFPRLFFSYLIPLVSLPEVSSKMETDLTDKMAAFSLTQIEDLGVKLDTTNVTIGYEEGSRSLIGKVFGDKKANFLGVKNSLMKL